MPTVRELLATLDELYGRNDRQAELFAREHADAIKAAQRGDRDAEAPVALVLALGAELAA